MSVDLTDKMIDLFANEDNMVTADRALLEKSEKALREKFQELEKERQKILLDQLNHVQHIYNHYDDRGGSFNFKVERNTKGFNYEITIQNCRSKEEAQQLLTEADGLVKTYIQAQTAEG